MTKRLAREVSGIEGSLLKGSLLFLEVDFLNVQLKPSSLRETTLPEIFRVANTSSSRRLLQTEAETVALEKKKIHFFLKKSNAMKTLV